MSLYGTRFRTRKEPTSPTMKIVSGVFTNLDAAGNAVGYAGKLTPFENYVTPNAPLEVEYTWDDKHPGPPFHTGGPFANIKIRHPSFKVLSKVRCNGASNQYGGTLHYNGGFCPNIISGWLSGIIPDAVHNPAFNPMALLTDNSALSPSVYGSLRPRLETGGLAVALAEARDIPRMLKTTAEGMHRSWDAIAGNANYVPHRMPLTMQPRFAADQFLNTQFGWVPFVKDVHQMMDTYVNSQRYIDRIRSRNGKWTTRTRTFQDDTLYDVTDTVYGLAVEPTLPYDFYTSRPLPSPLNGSGHYWYQVRTHIKKRTWAVGQFTYYRQEFDDSGVNSYDSAANSMKRHLMIHGLRINPSVVYRAIPWTWLIDWFSNVGDVIQYATDVGVDAMVSKYMYLMTHYVVEVSYKQTINLNAGPILVEWSEILETKQRTEADTPYGFELKWPDLSATQLAVLGSLGLSRRWII